MKRRDKKPLNRMLHFLRQEDKGAIGQPYRDQFDDDDDYFKALWDWAAGTAGVMSACEHEDFEARLSAKLKLAEMAIGYSAHREKIAERRLEREPPDNQREPARIDIIVAPPKEPTT